MPWGIGQEIQTAAEILNSSKISGWSRALLRAMQQLREGDSRNGHLAGMAVERVK